MKRMGHINPKTRTAVLKEVNQILTDRDADGFGPPPENGP
jgi:hypothetical protein